MRRPRSFWEARVAELARGRSVASVALQHGVLPGRLRWWRWRLGSVPPTAIVPARMIEILPAPPVEAAGGLRIPLFCTGHAYGPTLPTTLTTAARRLASASQYFANSGASM